VADRFTELARLAGRAKAAPSEHAAGDVDRAARVLMRGLADGPIRASELADRAKADLSTVSRHVAALVHAGLVERRPDPHDGRACLLVPSRSGQEMISHDQKVRATFFAQVLDDWNATELDRFAAMLTRFAADYEGTYRAWSPERSAAVQSSDGGTS
jgi:DNA-binding MarR family transcriptional regulator